MSELKDILKERAAHADDDGVYGMALERIEELELALSELLGLLDATTDKR